MAARNPGGPQRAIWQFFSALSSAFSEWLVITLLFIDAFCLYFLKKLSRSYRLQTPCLLCSRCGYVLGKEKLDCYRDLLCDSHKLELSSLAFCRVHKKLVVAREMCEVCIFSFAKRKPTFETSKFLLSKLCWEFGDSEQIFSTSLVDTGKFSQQKKDQAASSTCALPCACCSRTCRNKTHAFRLFQSSMMGKDLSYPNISTSSRMLARANHLDELFKTRAESLHPITIYQPPNHGLDQLHRLGYRELRITSESESEVPFSDDDDDGCTLACLTEDANGESMVQILKSLSSPNSAAPKNLSMISDNVIPEKLIHPDPLIYCSSVSASNEQSPQGNSAERSFVGSNAYQGYGLEEINWSHAEVKTNLPVSPKILSEAVLPKAMREKELLEVLDGSSTSAISNSEVTKVLNWMQVNPSANQLTTDSNYKIGCGVKAAQPSPRSSEINLTEEPLKLQEEQKQLSQPPGCQWLESTVIDTSHGTGKYDECKLPDTPVSNGLQSITRRSYNDLSGMESADGSIISEVEGEGIVNRLKRQLEMERKSLNILYKELEEERNASAIAANQAMAMINRLQEEKAAMRLEALQYLRMMEEQTEYEEEALQKLNDQLNERDKEILDLEAELENYRKQVGDETVTKKVVQLSCDSDESEYSTTSTPHVLKPRRRHKNRPANMLINDPAWALSGPSKENVLDFEDEREYISGCLKRLEKNLRLFSTADASRHSEEDDDFSYEMPEWHAKGENRRQHRLVDDQRTQNSLLYERPDAASCLPQEMKLKNGLNSSGKDPSSPSTVANSSPCKGAETAVGANGENSTTHPLANDCKHTKSGRWNDVSALCDEFAHLNARLEALEADRDFLERTINLLRNGKDGLLFVGEIANHLRELRKIGLTQWEHALDRNFLRSPSMKGLAW